MKSKARFSNTQTNLSTSSNKCDANKCKAQASGDAERQPNEGPSECECRVKTVQQPSMVNTKITKMIFLLTLVLLASYVPSHTVRLLYGEDRVSIPVWARLMVSSILINNMINPYIIFYFQQDVRQFV